MILDKQKIKDKAPVWIPWILVSLMSGGAGKLWNDLDIEITISKQKEEAVKVYVDLWEESQNRGE